MRKLPDEVKEAQGTLEKSRISPNPVSFDRCEGVPDPPVHLDEFGSAIWYMSAGNLHERNLLFKTDLPGLEAFCEAAMFKRIAAKEIIRGTEGSLKTRQNNWFRMWKDSAIVMDKYGSKFGFSPVDKTNIAIPTLKSERKSLLK